MILSFRSLALVVVAASSAQAAQNGDEKAAQLLIGVPASAWSRPAAVSVPSHGFSRPGPVRAGFAPSLPSSFFGATNGASRLLFLSPLSPLRAALRVAAQDLAAQDLAAQSLAAIDPPPPSEALDGDSEGADAEVADAADKRRAVILRQRRKSVLNDQQAGSTQNDGESRLAGAEDTELDIAGLSGRLELLTLPAGDATGDESESMIPGGAGLVRVSGRLTDDLTFALTGLAAESAATTWRAGAEFELSAGEHNQFEVGAVYGIRSNATNAPIGGEIDRRAVGAFRLVHALELSENVSTRAGGRFIDAPFLRSSRSIDPEISLLIESPTDGDGDDDGGRTFVRFDLTGDTLFPGLEVATGGSDLIALSEGLPVFANHFEAQRSWTRAVAAGYSWGGSSIEVRLQDQTVTHALLILPSSFAGAPFVQNGGRNRVEMGSVRFERIFADSQAQAGIEYGFGHFAFDARDPGRIRDIHQLTTRFDAYLRRSGTGIAIFHRIHEGASVVSREGDIQGRMRAQRYLIELRQDVPFVPAMIGADMALLVSVRNVYYDDVDRRNIDEFAVLAPPRRITGGIRVKF